MTTRMQLQAEAYAHGTSTAPRFQIVDRYSPVRPAMEERIRRDFARHFSARIAGFMPYLLKYDQSAGTGVLGFRPAAEEPLYLENYLDSPIELFLANVLRMPVLRSEVVEVGQFVVDDRASAAAMFRDLVPFLIERGHVWIAFTATRTIRCMLRRAGLSGLAIAAAREEKIRSQADDWGSYYSNDPQVVIGKLPDVGGHWCRNVRNRGRLLTAVE